MSSIARALAAAAALAVVAAGIVAANSSVGAQSAATSRTVGQSGAFVDAIGIDTHFNYTNSPYVLAWPELSAALIGSGIKHIRDGGKPDPQYVSRLATLGAHGIRHGAGFSIKATAGDIDAHLDAYAPYVDYIEGPNEFDSQRKVDPDWAARLVAFQKFLYQTVRANPAYAAVKVVGPPLEHQQYYADLGVLDQYQDAGNLHVGNCDENPGTSDTQKGNIAYIHALLRASAPSKPIWTTETGYGDDMSRHCAVDDGTIAKYVPRTIAEKWNAGEERIYLYQFADMPTDKVFGSTGLMHPDGSPKPQFTALASMVHLLADPGSPFVAKPLAYTLGGDTRDVHQTLLEKRDGSYDLLLWLEVRSWDVTHSVAIAPQTVMLNLPPSIASGKVFTYAPNWTLVAAPLQIRGGRAKLEVTDSISFVELDH